MMRFAYPRQRIVSRDPQRRAQLLAQREVHDAARPPREGAKMQVWRTRKMEIAQQLDAISYWVDPRTLRQSAIDVLTPSQNLKEALASMSTGYPESDVKRAVVEYLYRTLDRSLSRFRDRLLAGEDVAVVMPQAAADVLKTTMFSAANPVVSSDRVDSFLAGELHAARAEMYENLAALLQHFSDSSQFPTEEEMPAFLAASELQDRLDGKGSNPEVA